MRKSERYTVPLPSATAPPPVVYHDRFREFPFWYRWYLRALALINGMTIEQIVRRHDLSELRRRLAVVARDLVDTDGPALLPGFHHRLRELDRARRRVSTALQEINGNARGRFLVHVLERNDPETHHALENAAAIPETLLESTETTLAVAQEAVRTHLTAELEMHRALIHRVVHPLWESLQCLNLLKKFDMGPLLPPDHTGGVSRTPMRIVKTPLQELYQVLELVRRHSNRDATEYAWEYARRKAKVNPGPPGVIWSAVEEFSNAVPLGEMTRLAWDEPFLEIPPVSIRAEWWESYRHAWLSTSVERVGSQLFTHRNEQVREILSRAFLIDRPPHSWVPSELYPATLGYLLLIARSEYFHDTRRAVTQLVIDGVFRHLDTRNALHQAALQIDQALERLTALLGDGESRGTLGEELHRIRGKSVGTSLVRRRLVGLYERHRPRIRRAIEDVIGSLATGGTMVARTLSGTDVSFDYQELRAQSFSGEYTADELLHAVGDHWQPLGRRLRALYRIEENGA